MIDPRSTLLRLGGIAVLLAVLATGHVPATAQEGGGVAPPGSSTIHIVQRDENLFRIALQYGTTVEAIAAFNGIADVRVIAVGQRLLIPNAQTGASGVLVTHTVAPGDSLSELVARYHTTIEALAEANNLSNPALLYIGQRLIVPQGAGAGAQPAGSAPGTVHSVRPGQNIYRLAVQYDVPVNALVEANQLAWPAPLFFGQTLRIPGVSAPERATGLPYPLLDAQFQPLPAAQGKTLGLRLVTDGAAQISGAFMGRPLRFATHDASQHAAVFGISALAQPGIYPLTLTIDAANGQRTEITLRVQVESGGYAAEQIVLAAEQDSLLDPALTGVEDEAVARVMGGFTTQRHFDGMMGLPSAGAITSQFGTRRSYNHGALSTFHSGTDFGAGPGAPIIAPAAGVVALTEALSVRGNATIIDHGWGVYSGFWHQAEIKVKVGDVVTPGQVIGLVGSTGRSTGPHLHWELWVGGAQVDPMQWVQQSFP